MRVPSHFKLGGRTWKVVLRDTLSDDQGKHIWGLCHGDTCLIELKATDNLEQLEHSFWHELVHAICYTIGYPKLNDNEHRVDSIACMMMQVRKTKKGEATVE